jgi:predicted dienelactone hydrolase
MLGLRSSGSGLVRAGVVTGLPGSVDSKGRISLRRIIASLSAAVLVAGCTTHPPAPPPSSEPALPLFSVGVAQMEFVDQTPDEGQRHLSMNIFYPAQPPAPDATPLSLPFATDLSIFNDLAPLTNGRRHPLILFSHGRGSNGLQYAWFAQTLASHGYIVAALDHYHANTYESSIIYLANKLWQRPRDITLSANVLLADPRWGPLIDPARIGVAGHSQGGFTALWLGGARVNPDLYLAFQRGWKNNPTLPAYVRNQLPLDAGPAEGVADGRIKAVFAMAPGIIKSFGMDETGLRQLTVPTYITVGARDTQTPPAQNAEFAANNIPGAVLDVLPGNVDHEIFVNECNQDGRDEFPEACIDAPGVDRAAEHRAIGEAALKFFNVHLGG